MQIPDQRLHVHYTPHIIMVLRAHVVLTSVIVSWLVESAIADPALVDTYDA